MYFKDSTGNSKQKYHNVRTWCHKLPFTC